jgi:hypothetical protein
VIFREYPGYARKGFSEERGKVDERGGRG